MRENWRQLIILTEGPWFEKYERRKVKDENHNETEVLTISAIQMTSDIEWELVKNSDREKQRKFWRQC